MIDLDADLVPGVSAAGIRLGTSIHPILGTREPDSIEQRIGVRVLKYGPVWIFDASGKVDQICVWEGYRGKLNGRIGIGSPAGEARREFSPTDFLESAEYEMCGPGWCFMIAPDGPAIDRPNWESAPITCLCITLP